MTRRPGGARRNLPDQGGSDPGRRGAIAAIAALAAGVALLVAAGVRTSASPDRSDPPQEVPVSSVTRSCPSFGTEKAAAQTVGTTTLSLPSARTGGDSSAVELPGGRSVDALGSGERGSWASGELSSGKTRAVVLSASGASAAGSVAFGATKANDSLGGGLAVSDCPTPARDSWFVGAGSSAEHQTTLVLTNATESPAVVDLSLLGDKGPVEGVGGDGILVEPGSVKRVQIQDLAAGESELAVHAEVRRGALSVSALDVTRSGSQPGGSEWIPSAAAPARTQVVAGVADGTRTLLVANDGDRTATVAVRMIGKDGTFTAKKLDEIEVEPGTVKTVEVPSDVDDKALGVALSSDVPVTAAVRTTTTNGSPTDVAYAVAREPVTDTAVVALSLGNVVQPSDTTVLLAGQQEDDATAVVTGYDRDGKPLGDDEVTVPAGTTLAFHPSDKKWLDVDPDKLAYLTIEPSRASLRAAAAYETGAGISAVPVTAAPMTVPAPAAEPGS